MTTSAPARRPHGRFHTATGLAKMSHVTLHDTPTRGRHCSLQIQHTTTATPGDARTWMRAHLQSQGIDPATVDLDAIELVLSELVTNTVLHGGSAVTLTAYHADGVVHIQVADRGKHEGAADGRAEGEHGLGLMIVQGLCDELDIDRAEAGWTVTAAVRTDGSAP